MKLLQLNKGELKMQEKFFLEFLQVFLQENPSPESVILLKRYIDRVPVLALSEEIFATLKKHEIKESSLEA